MIVGGGHNGLVAAAYLARAGRSVLLLERLTGGARQGGRTGHRPHRRYFLGYVPRRAG
nr:FAD-dependent oxidoreductase [Streptomyces sp. RKAG337]